jgi:GAF domain-containing protein
MLDKAMRLCGAAFGSLYTYDGERFLSAAHRGVPPAYAEFRARHPPVRTQGGGIAALVETRKPVHTLDAAAHELYRAGRPGVRGMVELGGVRTELMVPLLKDNALIGFISVYRQEVRAFSDKQIALLESFADQAVIAMENARLLTETREALEQQTATAEVLQVINSSPGELAPVFDAMLDRALRLCSGAYGSLLTFDGEKFLSVATRGDTRFADWARQRGPFEPPSEGPLHRSLKGEDIVEITDLLEHSEIHEDPVIRRMVELGGYRSLLNVALRQESAFFGVIAIYRKEKRPFDNKEVALLQNFAAQAVVAMENARLLTETREALEQQTATAEILRVISGSPTDVQPTFDAIAAAATTLTDAALSGVVIYDGRLMHLAALSGFTVAEVDKLRGLWPIPADQGTATGRAILTRQIVQIDEISTDPEYAYPTLAQSSGQTVLAVPMLRDGIPIGAINVQRRHVEQFTEKQIELFKTFADQAVIAIENVRLFNELNERTRELQEALEHQTATAEVLQVINSSPGDLAPVFDAVLEKAMRFCEADVGNFWTYDGEAFSAVAMRDPRPAHVEWARQRRRGGPGSISDSLIRGESVIHIPDAADTDAYRAGEPARRAIVDLNGGRTLLAVALRKGDELLGYITVFRRVVHPFSDKQIALLQNFAAQAVIAMENARLLTETQDALKQQTATAEVLQVINSSPGDLRSVFEVILEKAHALCGADHGALSTYDGERFRAVALHAMPEQFGAFLRQPYPPYTGGAQERLLRGAPLVHIPDIRVRPPTTPIHHAAIEAGIRSLLIVPLRKHDQLLGYITANRREVSPFTDKQIALLQNFASQAVIAMENARLLSELRERTDQVAELNRGLEARVAEQVEELGRVGRLKRFLAPQLAELIVSQGNEQILESHRREIVVVFCDLRGYTAFAETAEPEEVLEFLRDYHGALGPLVAQFEGTLDQFSGDGIMVFFNDPVPIPAPAARAVNMAVAMRAAAGTLIADWRERGRDLGFGAGIAQGYATLGQIGFSERSGYTAIGTVCNVAARLCAEAKDGQILLSQRVNVALRGSVVTEQVGALALKGLTQPVVAYNVPSVGSQAAFRIIEGGAPSA